MGGGSPRRARLKVIEGFGKGEIHAFALAAMAPNTRLVTDDWPSYNRYPRHQAQGDHGRSDGGAHIALPWTHRLFSKLKRWGLGVYHGLRKTNLQHYLDEFVFASIAAGCGMPPSILSSDSPPAPRPLPSRLHPQSRLTERMI